MSFDCNSPGLLSACNAGYFKVLNVEANLTYYLEGKQMVCNVLKSLKDRISLFLKVKARNKQAKYKLQ